MKWFHSPAITAAPSVNGSGSANFERLYFHRSTWSLNATSSTGFAQASTTALTANPVNISICSGSSRNGTMGGADDAEEKQGLPDAELYRKTAAHSRLAIFPEQGYSKRN